MMRLVIGLAVLLGACQRDETISAYAEPGATYALVEMSGRSVDAPITLGFPRRGAASGRGPCNVYSATQTAPYPWIAFERIRTTRRACPDLAVETRYFDMLAQMRIAEVAGDILILSGEGGETLVYHVSK